MKLVFKKHWYFYFTLIGLLLYVLLFGKDINGSKAWIDFGFISLQPSEFMKVSLMLTLSTLCIKNINIYKCMLLVLIPSLLTFLEPDTGAILIYLIILGVLICSKASKKTIIVFITLIVFISLLCFLIYYFNTNLFIDIFGTSMFYRIDRIKSFVNVDNIQIENALIAISTGKHLYYPEASTDFVFALIVSNYWYFLIVILICYIVIFLYFNYKMNHYNEYVSCFSKILFYILLFQFGYNIFMNIGLVPIIGIPLPFLSYGGSSNMAFVIMIGLVLNQLNSTD